MDAATLHSIFLNYVERRGSRPPEALQQAINKLKRHDDNVITKPDESSGTYFFLRKHPSSTTKVHHSFYCLKEKTLKVDRLKTTALYFGKSNILLRRPENPSEPDSVQTRLGLSLSERFPTSPSLWSYKESQTAATDRSHQYFQPSGPTWLDVKLKVLARNCYRIFDTFSFIEEIRKHSRE